MTVRYEAVNAMLLNEFLKEHRSVQDLKETVVQQQKQLRLNKRAPHNSRSRLKLLLRDCKRSLLKLNQANLQSASP